MVRLGERWSNRNWVRYGGVFPVVAAAGLASDLFYRLTGTSRVSSIFLAGVLLSAYLFGSGPAYLATAVSFLVYLWLVDPRYQWSFGSPEDFDALMVFLAVASLIGLLIGRVRDDAAAATRRAQAADSLLDATRSFSAATEEDQIRDQLVRRVAGAARGEAFIRQGLNLRTWPEGILDRELTRGSAAIERKSRNWGPTTVRSGVWTARALRAGGEDCGVVGFRTPAGGLGQEEAALVDILIDTGAAAISRARLSAAKAEAESRARTEDLRNALLASVSHDVRTPLAAIMASASSLVNFGGSFDDATRRDLASTIQEEAVRLDSFVSNLLNMSRLEAGALQIRSSPFSVPEVVNETVRRRRGAGSERISVSLAPGLPEAMGDPTLLAQALGNVCENALRYAGRKGPVVIAAAAASGRIDIEVLDEGPGVPDEDLGRIFEKFYRAPGARNGQGTGLGLSIARGLVEAMGGSIEAANRDDPRGLAVRISLPIAA